ncbi:MAG: Rrf2 family transcriptional regulator [Christensenellales bacterium]
MAACERPGWSPPCAAPRAAISCAKPDQISVGHIIDAMEGPLNLSECATEGECECPRSEGCKTRRVWEYLTDSINRLLYSITLQDMLESKEMNES